MLAESESGHAHHHSTGIHWVDLIVALSAIFISIVSLVVSIEHGRMMQDLVKENKKMVAGSTMPFLTEQGNQFEATTGRPRLRLILQNGGVGPARIEWFEVRYRGQPYIFDDLLPACCRSALPKGNIWPGAFYSGVSGTILPPRESVDFIDLHPEAGKDLMNALNAARRDLTFNACYCSVLDECWQTDFSSSHPKRVETCSAPPGNTPW
ncbi:MAG TPA: hypothetical protein VFR24_26680 [Candidatus Angelobacter sp.]|nr:hypothetical protein [Candidatus Angelobacter sp.]